MMGGGNTEDCSAARLAILTDLETVDFAQCDELSSINKHYASVATPSLPHPGSMSPPPPPGEPPRLLRNKRPHGLNESLEIETSHGISQCYEDRLEASRAVHAAAQNQFVNVTAGEQDGNTDAMDTGEVQHPTTTDSPVFQPMPRACATTTDWECGENLSADPAGSGASARLPAGSSVFQSLVPPTFTMPGMPLCNDRLMISTGCSCSDSGQGSPISSRSLVDFDEAESTPDDVEDMGFIVPCPPAKPTTPPGPPPARMAPPPPSGPPPSLPLGRSELKRGASECDEAVKDCEEDHGGSRKLRCVRASSTGAEGDDSYHRSPASARWIWDMMLWDSGVEANSRIVEQRVLHALDSLTVQV